MIECKHHVPLIRPEMNATSYAPDRVALSALGRAPRRARVSARRAVSSSRGCSARTASIAAAARRDCTGPCLAIYTRYCCAPRAAKQPTQPPTPTAGPPLCGTCRAAAPAIALTWAVWWPSASLQMASGHATRRTSPFLVASGPDLNTDPRVRPNHFGWLLGRLASTASNADRRHAARFLPCVAHRQGWTPPRRTGALGACTAESCGPRGLLSGVVPRALPLP